MRNCVVCDESLAAPRLGAELCVECMGALRGARMSARRLYKLAAYLELDTSRPSVYLIGSLRNPDIAELGNHIRSLGLECLDNWWSAGPGADDAWQEYSNLRGRTFQEALASREARHTFNFDAAYLELATAVVMAYPAGKSAHLELGYAVGLGKRAYILQEHPPERYDVMLQFASAPVFSNHKELLQQLKKDLLGGD